MVWNRRHDKRPGLIVRCAGPADVARTVDFARDERLPLAVRSGGHSQAGYSTCDGGVVLDLSRISAVDVDRSARTVRSAPGARIRDLDLATRPVGLELVLGSCPSVAIAGLTLGGGYGWLSPLHGAACDNLLEAEVVLASGEIVTASTSQNSDLFWALRGGGGNFGIATSLTLQAHPDQVYAGAQLTYDIGQTRAVLEGYREFSASAPEALAAQLNLASTPRGPLLALGVLHLGDPAEGERALEPLRSVGRAISTSIRRLDYHEWQVDNYVDPPPAPSLLRTAFLPTLTDEVISALSMAATSLPPGLPIISLFRFAGAATRPRGSAFPLHTPGFNYFAAAVWTEESQREPGIRWLEELHSTIAPFTHGAYLNGMDAIGASTVREVYAESYDRLSRLKGRYDPDNLFRLNANILPS